MAGEKSDHKILEMKLKECRDTIINTKPTSDKKYVDRLLNPSDQKDWREIAYFRRVSQSFSKEWATAKIETFYICVKRYEELIVYVKAFFVVAK